MTQTRTNTRPCLLRRSTGRYDNHMWELLKNMYRNAGDNYPKNAGTYRVEFLDGPVSAARRFEMFVERMTETRIDFSIIAVNEGYRRIAVVYSHKGFDESLFVDDYVPRHA